MALRAAPSRLGPRRFAPVAAMIWPERHRRKAVERHGPEGVAGGVRAGGWGSVARLISWPIKTDAGIGHAGLDVKSSALWLDGSCDLKYREGSPEGSVGAANILRGTGGSCFFGTCS